MQFKYQTPVLAPGVRFDCLHLLSHLPCFKYDATYAQELYNYS